MWAECVLVWKLFRWATQFIASNFQRKNISDILNSFDGFYRSFLLAFDRVVLFALSSMHAVASTLHCHKMNGTSSQHRAQFSLTYDSKSLVHHSLPTGTLWIHSRQTNGTRLQGINRDHRYAARALARIQSKLIIIEFWCGLIWNTYGDIECRLNGYKTTPNYERKKNPKSQSKR